ncbi:hypothetical protein PN497_15480 [Sphaerospermopsis kisseleviana CS-549]|uniref:Uncharacterized protein n=1 Tax=Sphaerospermopsis kisseleviana CS-549 TaxID=3021783 RepID=A0ABT4ZTK0_9CYAN|nr:hypothetical protein [Sphaerospermopsis kisseleviana]MDB9442753.1 hypothetical protein [Sphaerospermopsis kisseleviana CS-549]
MKCKFFCKLKNLVVNYNHQVFQFLGVRRQEFKESEVQGVRRKINISCFLFSQSPVTSHQSPVPSPLTEYTP